MHGRRDASALSRLGQFCPTCYTIGSGPSAPPHPAAGKPLATLGIDSEVRFASAKDRAAFAVELADAVNGLVAKYHDEAAPRGRPHRFVVALHPTITRKEPPS